MEDALLIDRLQFAFTVIFHYLFPQLTMGLALLIVIMKGMALRTGDSLYDKAALFWTRIFALNFAMGVVTGIPMEFQFGTNWARFSELSGGVVGNTLALEGVYAFFLESTFVGLFLYGANRLNRWAHFGCAVMVFLGSWLSGYFIVATNAWMQHPVAYEIGQNGHFSLTSLTGLLTNPWAVWQYLHTMIGSVITASFVVSGVGAYYLLAHQNTDAGKLFLRVAVPVAAVATILAALPTGDMQAKNVAKYQPVTFAAMEGLFENQEGAELVLIGQPNMRERRIDNPIAIPKILSFMLYTSFNANVKGLEEFPESDWPTNVPMLYYSYRIMAGLGTLFIALSCTAGFLLWRGRLHHSRTILWFMLLAVPFPYIANTAGWMTAETGRQPWLIHGLMRTADGVSPHVSSGSGLFSLLGFVGLYTLLGLLFALLVLRDIRNGPERLGGQ